MKEIGGYFELELNDFNDLYHNNALALNSGRNCLEHILNNSKYKHIYIPYYTCEVILEPLKKSGILYTFYNIDQNFMPIISILDDDDALLYTNYFGLMNIQVEELSKKITNLIVDNAQAFYDMPLKDIPTFYSPRKFFGLPDGGFVYTTVNCEHNDFEIDSSIDRMSYLIGSIELGKEYFYEDFKTSEMSLIKQPIKKMSEITKRLLNSIDFKKIKEIRLSNFYYIHDKLKMKNELSYLIDEAEINVPMIYPLLISDIDGIRMHLIKNRIYVAQYWPNVLDWIDKESFEYNLAKNIIPISINQHYNIDDLDYIVQTINDFIYD